MIPFAFWKPSTLNPATISLDGWWRASWASSPWVGNASTGGSGSNNVSAGTAPAVGTALNGLNPANFNGTSHVLVDNSGTASTQLARYITTTQYRISMLVNLTSVSAPGAHPYTDRNILSSNGGNWGVSATTSGIGIYHNDGAYKTAFKACATGGWHAVDIVYDGTNLTVSVDGVAGTPVAAGALASTVGNFIMGANFASAVFYSGLIADLSIAKTKLAAVTAAQFKAYYNARYALTL